MGVLENDSKAQKFFNNLMSTDDIVDEEIDKNIIKVKLIKGFKKNENAPELGEIYKNDIQFLKRYLVTKS